MPAASAVSIPIVSGDFGKWERILRHSKSNQSDILQGEIARQLQSHDKKTDPNYTAQQAAGDVLQTLHQKFDKRTKDLKEQIQASSLMDLESSGTLLHARFESFEKLHPGSPNDYIKNLSELIENLRNLKTSFTDKDSKTSCDRLESTIKEYARVKLWCDVKDSMTPAAAASANPNLNQEKFFEQLKKLQNNLTSDAEVVLRSKEKSVRNILQETFRTDSTENQIATMSSNMPEIAKKMDEERNEKCEKIKGESKTLQEDLKKLQARTKTAFDNIQSEIDALQKKIKINDSSIDATQKAVAQERIPKLEGLKTEIKTIHDEIGKVTQKPFEELSKKINDLDKQKNPVLFKGELTATQVAMRDSENAYKGAKKIILNTENERLHSAAISFRGENVASTFQTAAKNTAIPAEAQEAFQTLATTTSRVYEQCQMLITLDSKMITKEAQELYLKEYQNTLNQMDKLLTKIAIQIKSRYNTFIYACAQGNKSDKKSLENNKSDKKSLENAFNALRRLDDEVYAQRKQMMGKLESAKMTMTEDRQHIANPAANPGTVSGENLGRGFEIYHYKRTDEYDKTSPLEKTYAKDKNGNHLNLSIKEIEQLVNTINQERNKDGKALLKLEITNKGNNRYAFTIDCHDKETKMQALNKMVEVQNKRVEALEKQNTASVKTANTPGAGTASKTEGAFQPFSGTGHTLRDSTATTPTPSPATPAASANPTPTVLPPRASGLPDPQDVRREIMNRAAEQRYATQIADAKKEMP